SGHEVLRGEWDGADRGSAAPDTLSPRVRSTPRRVRGPHPGSHARARRTVMRRLVLACVVTVVSLLPAAAALAQTATPARAPQPGRVYKVAYSQIVDHPALNETRRGFLDGLKQAGFVEGQNLNFLYQNAQGDVGNARNIAEKFLADGVDVLTPCTTPNVQAAVKVAKGGRTPVVFACVTDP